MLAGSAGLLAPILADAEAQGATGASGWVLQGSQVSGSRVVCMRVGPPGAPAAAMVKIPTTEDRAASQLREGGVLAALAGESALGDFRHLVPARLAGGVVDGHPYTVEALIPGTDGHRLSKGDPALAGRVLAAAAAAIGELHRRTAATVEVDAALAGRWVGERVRVLSQATRDRGALARLEASLTGAWMGRRLAVSWIHGDFWSANIMFDPATLAVTGILDWEWAGPTELSALDLLYLLLQGRMVAEGREFGAVLPPLLAGDAWTPAERAVLEAGGVLEPGQPAASGELLLLTWLRHVAFDIVQSPGDARNWVWTGRNVDPILRLV